MITKSIAHGIDIPEFNLRKAAEALGESMFYSAIQAGRETPAIFRDVDHQIQARYYHDAEAYLRTKAVRHEPTPRPALPVVVLSLRRELHDLPAGRGLVSGHRRHRGGHQVSNFADAISEADLLDARDSDVEPVIEKTHCVDPAEVERTTFRGKPARRQRTPCGQYVEYPAENYSDPTCDVCAAHVAEKAADEADTFAALGYAHINGVWQPNEVNK